MAKVVRFAAAREASVVDEPEAELGAGDVRIRTLYSGISAGTELTAYRGSNPYLDKRWDPERRLFVPGDSTLAYPVDGWGYEEVGEIVEVGGDVRDVQLGQVVWGTWGHRALTTKPAEYAAQRVLAPGIDPKVGIFSQIGAIALNVMLDADIHVGETVAVFGLGVPGQLVAQLAALNGARVIGVDTLSDRLAKARELGADTVLDATKGEVAERIHELTEGRGADVALEVSGAYPALHEAIRSVAYSARVVAAGFFQREGMGLALGEEFHHNRVQVMCSQISGVAPALSYRWDTYRLQRTAVDLAASGKLQVLPLISEVVPVDGAPAAFRALDESPAKSLQVVIEF
ncbi:MAG: zinc-binding dehydrogenase [Streptosporangiales bacterium]|nr:zinc-binding dehydrogenase [Streptosporangiales bacterium]